MKTVPALVSKVELERLQNSAYKKYLKISAQIAFHFKHIASDFHCGIKYLNEIALPKIQISFMKYFSKSTGEDII